MAKRKLTAKQIAAGFGGKRAQAAQKATRKRRRTNKERKALGYHKERTMAKGKRKSSRRRRGSVVRRRVTTAFKRHRVDLAAAGVAAAYGYAQGAEMSVLQSVPVLTPIGRAGTLALIAYGLAKFGIAPKYTSAIARGMTNIAVYNLGRRHFRPYDETEARAIMSGADEALLGAAEGDVDEVGVEMDYEPAA